MFNKSNSFGFLFFIVLLVACNSLPYQSTNRLYKKQTKALVKQIYIILLKIHVSKHLKHLL